MVVLALSTLYFLHLHFAYQQAIQAKYTPTEFGLLRYNTSTTSEQLGKRHDILAARQQWKHLGSGFEGTTYTWGGYVIKMFDPTRSPPRNCVPSMDGAPGVDRKNQPVSRWPTEIPASLVLGGQETVTTLGRIAFLPVIDFFLASATNHAQPEWHLVTPLIAGGDLFSLANRIRHSSTPTSYRELDVRFRPAFHHLLSTLHVMHNRSLCHDDIKADNIFVGEYMEWFIGDLGNVRQLTHPYHSSRIWQTNSQLANCRANDVLRAVRAYLQFLRAATGNGAAFDLALFEGKEPWSRLFWIAVEAGELSAQEMLEWSQSVENAETSAHYLSKYETIPGGFWNLFAILWFGEQGALHRAANHLLTPRLAEGWARKMAVTALFGMPVSTCLAPAVEGRR